MIIKKATWVTWGEKRKARKSADGAWFSWCLAHKNTCEVLPSCLENRRGTVHLGWQGHRGLGTAGDSDTFQRASTTLPTPLGGEVVSRAALQSRRKRLLLRAENHKSRRFSEVTQKPWSMAPPCAAVPGLGQGHSPDTAPCVRSSCRHCKQPVRLKCSTLP